MNPNFSFKYGENEYTFSAENNKVYELEKGVNVTAIVKEYKEYDAVEWVLYFENQSDKNSGIFSDINDCDTLLELKMPETKRIGYMPKDGQTCVITMNGMVDGSYYWVNDKVSATEYGYNKEYLEKLNKTLRFANVSGRSSDGMMPFFDVTALNAGYIMAIGWSGDWKSEFTRHEGGVRIKTGLKETKFYLKPGEKIRTTSVLIMKYSDDEDKYNKFRGLIRNHFSHKACTQAHRSGLFALEFWGGLPSEEMKKRLNELKDHDIKFEDLWIDAGWYGNCTKCDDPFSGDWSRHTGEWEVNARVHPGELRDVSECAKDVGARLMLWFEPERAIEGTKVAEKHPEWFISVPNDISKILNYGNDDARKYVCDLLLDYAEKLDLSCYRQDFNTELTKYFKANDEENRRGITEIKHIMGMYEIWDTLLDKFPGIIIDNCSSGGRRIDIETLKRSIPFFRTDYQCNFNENSEVLQTHNVNISQYLPFNGCTTKTKNDMYAARSSYSSSWGGAFYATIFANMDENDFKWIKKVTEEYASIRKYMYKDFYNHASNVFDDTSWAVWQYHDPDTQSGIVMAFRREKSPFDTVKINLKGILKGKTYEIKNLDDGTTQNITDTLEIVLPQKRSSTIIEYTIKK